jgi:hypothetical protein
MALIGQTTELHHFKQTVKLTSVGATGHYSQQTKVTGHDEI